MLSSQPCGSREFPHSHRPILAITPPPQPGSRLFPSLLIAHDGVPPQVGLSGWIRLPDLNVPCLGPRHRTGWGRQGISLRGSCCTLVGRSFAGQWGAGAPPLQPLPTAEGTPWRQFGVRASGAWLAGPWFGRLVGRSIAIGNVNQFGGECRDRARETCLGYRWDHYGSSRRSV